MSTNDIGELQEGLRAARDAVLASIDGVSEDEAHQIPMPGEWTVAQLLAHVAELQTFWVDKAVLITLEDDPNIARTAVEEDRRIGAVIAHTDDRLAGLTNEMVAATERAVATVGSIDPALLDRPGRREANPMTAGGVIEYVAGHLRTHAEQIAETLRMVRQQS